MDRKLAVIFNECGRVWAIPLLSMQSQSAASLKFHWSGGEAQIDGSDWGRKQAIGGFNPFGAPLPATGSRKRFLSLTFFFCESVELQR